MKYRKDFVTNSSSSSYICEICGADAHGMDLSIRDAEMCECVNGHIFCNDHSLERPSKEEMLKDILARGLDDYSEEELREMSEDTLYNSEYITYVCQKHNLIPAEIVNGWKEKFGTYENFSNFIK